MSTYYHDYDYSAQFEDLRGRILANIEVNYNGRCGDEILFITDTGEIFKMYHEQDCCKSVSIEFIVGDLADLIDSPILLAEERSQDDQNACESGTWTFYTVATRHGYVDIRWYGSSNGYYSERVHFRKVK